jgi:hypothetical protein
MKLKKTKLEEFTRKREIKLFKKEIKKKIKKTTNFNNSNNKVNNNYKVVKKIKTIRRNL